MENIPKNDFTEENKLLSMEELESKAAHLNFKFEEQVARKAATMKLLEESGAKHVQKTGAFLMPLSKEQREVMQKNTKTLSKEGSEIKAADPNLKHEELSPLTDYYWQRSKAAQEEVEQMSKHPLSLEQIRKQIEEDRVIIAARK